MVGLIFHFDGGSGDLNDLISIPKRVALPGAVHMNVPFTFRAILGIGAICDESLPGPSLGFLIAQGLKR